MAYGGLARRLGDENRIIIGVRGWGTRLAGMRSRPEILDGIYCGLFPAAYWFCSRNDDSQRGILGDMSS